jgi:diaminopimelate epimerase
MNRMAPNGLPLRKMHGLGNDFVVIDARGGSSPVDAALARALGDRHRGVGFDQLAVIRDGDGADAVIDFWNADGTMAQACGNATRCVAEMLFREDGADALTLRTERGLLPCRRRADGVVEVNMGQPVTDWRSIPLAEECDIDALPILGSPSAISMGNPHCVFFVENAEAAPVTTLGPEIERHPLFPERTNVEFVQVLSRTELRMRVWERGAGVTLACGSGACAAAVAAARRGLTGRRVTLHLDGGPLEIDWTGDGVLMAGPTAHVFDGVLTADFMASVR